MKCLSSQGRRAGGLSVSPSSQGSDWFVEDGERLATGDSCSVLDGSCVLGLPGRRVGHNQKAALFFDQPANEGRCSFNSVNEAAAVCVERPRRRDRREGGQGREKQGPTSVGRLERRSWLDDGAKGDEVVVCRTAVRRGESDALEEGWRQMPKMAPTCTR